jgi:hypothetical protein
MRVAILATFCVLLHIIGIPFYKTLAGILALIFLWNLPDILKQSITRKWRW